MSTEEKRPGRPSKGPRKSRMFRYPFPLDAALNKAAQEGKYADVQELMIEVLTEAMRERGYLSDDLDEEEGRLLSA